MKSLAVAIIFILSHAAGAALSDDLIQALPSPMNFLAKSNEAGADLQTGLLGYLKSECPHLKTAQQTERGCDILNSSRKYTELLAKLRAGSSGVEVSAPSKAVKPWDLTALLAGHFLITQNIDSASAGRDLMIEIFVTRDQILNAVERSYAWVRKSHQGPLSPELIMYPAFMRAYFLTSTPLGALGETFRSLKCGLHENSCEIMKRLWGSVCQIAVEQNESAFDDLDKRMTTMSADDSSVELPRIKFIQSLASYVEQGQLDRDSLSKKIDDLDGAGQAGFANPDFDAVTLSVLIYGELKQLVALKYNCLSYTDDISEKIKVGYRKRLVSISTASLDAVESALQIYGQNHELKGNEP